MKKLRYKFIILFNLVLSSCTSLNLVNSDNSKDKLLNENPPLSSLNTNSNISVDKVEIKILIPTDKKNSNWYKKDDKTIVMKVGSQAELIGTVLLKNNTKSSNVSWSSSDNTLVNINNGKITANKIGVSTIQAISNIDPKYSDFINIEILDDSNFSLVDSENINKVKKIESYVKVNGENMSSLSIVVGDSISALSVVTLNDETKNSNVIWESSDQDIATVTSSGNIVARKVGVTTIVSKYKLNPDFKSLINIEVLDKQASNNQSHIQENVILEKKDDNDYNPPKIVFSKMEMEESDGNGDNIPNRGETINLYPYFTNLGGVSSNDLDVEVQTENSFILINDYYNSTLLQALKPNISKKVNSYFKITIDKDTEPDTEVLLNFKLKDRFGNEYKTYCKFIVR